MYYTISEMAEKLGVTAYTLRYYDKEGLLPFVERSDSGIRRFKDSDFEWLSIIECLKSTGMPLKDIKVFVDWCIQGDGTIDQRLQLIERQRKAVLSQMEQLQQTIDTLDYKCWYYQTAKAAGTCAVHQGMGRENVPERFYPVLDRLQRFSAHQQLTKKRGSKAG